LAFISNLLVIEGLGIAAHGVTRANPGNGSRQRALLNPVFEGLYQSVRNENVLDDDVLGSSQGRCVGVDLLGVALAL
jgi:hypothetical protein